MCDALIVNTTPSGEPFSVRLSTLNVSTADPSPQFTTTEPAPLVKLAIVALGLALENVPSRVPTSLGPVSGVEFPSMPVISVPFELVSVASSTVTPPPGGLVNVVVTPPRVVMMTLRVSGMPAGVSSAVRVAAENLEDRVAVGGIDADLLDGERDAGDGRRAVAPAADRERRVDVGDRRQGVGVFERRQHERAGVHALTVGEALGGEPVTGRSVTVTPGAAAPVTIVTVEPPSS